MFLIKFWTVRENISGLEKSAPPEHFQRLNHTLSLIIGHKIAVWLILTQKQQFNLVQPEYYLTDVEEIQQMHKPWFHVLKLKVQQKE